MVHQIGNRPSSTISFYILLNFIILLCISQQALTSMDTAYFYVGCYTARTDLLKESVYAKIPQTCIEICDHQNLSYAVLSTDKCFCTEQLLHEERQDEQLCNTRCLASKLQYCGGVGVHSYYSTSFIKQLAPNNLRVVNSTEHSITVAWDAFELQNLYKTGVETPALTQTQITNFLIKSHVVQTFSSLPFFPQPEFIVQNTETSFEITDLQPATIYNVSVKAMCQQNICGSDTLEGRTVVGQPSPPPPVPKVLARNATTITIEIPSIRNDNGPVTKLLVIVERIDSALSQTFDTELLGSWEQAQNDGLPYYIAAELEVDRPEYNRARHFVVGDNKHYGRYYNPPLEKLTDSKDLPHVHVSLGVVSTLGGQTRQLYTRSTHAQHVSFIDDFSYATFEKGRTSVIALAVICIIFATCLLLSVITYFYLRYKTYCNRTGGRLSNTHELTLQQPIMERENNGYVIEEDIPPTLENFKQQLNALVESLELMKLLPRNALRLNVNDVIAEGRYGEVITGKLISSTLPTDSTDCQLHVLALDALTSADQAQLLREFRNLTQLRRHDNILDFYGISASNDWFYFVFEQQHITLKRRLIESRRAPNTSPVQRITTLSEKLVLQWIYELANAMSYLSSCKVLHKKLCSHNVYVTADSKLKLNVFGPVHYINNRKTVDLARWSAPEMLRYQHYSTKSDVWSFACVAWECCALGGTLYANINQSQKLLDAIKSGSRPAQPAYVYEDLYQLLHNCWQLEPSERIHFDDIALSVRQLLITSPRHALCFDRAPEVAGNNIVDALPFFMPMLEMVN